MIALAAAPVIEKIIIAVIIVICFILLAVGLGLLLDGDYTSGAVVGLLGAGGMGATVYWAFHPALKVGGWEDWEDNVVDVDGSGEDYDVDFLDGGEDFDELPVDYNVSGAHEESMLADFNHMIEMLRDTDGSDGLTSLLEKIKDGSKTSMSSIEQLKSAIKSANTAEVREAYNKLSSEDKEQVRAILDSMKELSENVEHGDVSAAIGEFSKEVVA
jgi:hypothetical protein